MNQIILRKKQVDELKAIIRANNPDSLFLVRDEKSYTPCGAERFVRELTDNREIPSFYEFEPNPQIDDLKKGIETFRKSGATIILAIGGGSVLDMAKLISVFAHQSENIEDIVDGKAKLNGNKTPLIAIPTTAGTGAEATKFAVLYMGKKKFSVEHASVLPNYVYLSPEFSMTASPYLTASTGLDAFCQAAESLWSVNANSESETYSLEALRLVWENLVEATTKNCEKAKANLLEAAFLAGKAINITKTTAPHAVSYAFTSFYGIPHGHAVALSFPFFLQFNYGLTEKDCTDSRGPKNVQSRIDKILTIMGCDIAQSVETLTRFFNSVGINIHIREIAPGFEPEIIVRNVNTQRLTNNPRRVDAANIREFLG
jgi:alcohol dehydrogenase class IV